jgi:iron complex transport system substrate-binding protein
MFTRFPAQVALALALGLSAAPAVASAPPRAPAARIVSLIPSLTEDLFAIGAGAQVVGVSQFTDYPAAAVKVPQVASFASIDAEKILGLHPDIVVAIPAQSPLLGDVRRLGLKVVLLPDDSYDDIFRDLAELGRLSGHAGEAAALSAKLRARTAALVRGVPHGSRPRTFVVLGVSPIFTAGNGSFIAHLLELAGARNAASDLPTAYGRYGAEALLAAQPDVLIADKASDLPAVLDRAPWNALRAVREKRYYVLDDPDILERPGPRYVDGLAWLIARVHSHAAP